MERDCFKRIGKGLEVFSRIKKLLNKLSYKELKRIQKEGELWELTKRRLKESTEKA